MEVLVIGSGGREHAITWAVARSKKATGIYCAPGNAGTAGLAENVDIKADDVDGLLKFALEKKIGLTIVGPEVPLVMGLVDMFEGAGLKAFGPREDGAQMEGSKVFSKNLFKKYNIPTAAFSEFDNSRDAIAYIKAWNKYPVVIKADGLAAGKGVIIAQNETQAIAAASDIMDRKIFGGAGEKIVVEEFLEGDEASILAFTDGETVLPLPASQDHKRIYDGDLGPNTGGMGAYAPTPLITPAVLEVIKRDILHPTVAALKSEGINYKGILYAGIMMTKYGPKVLEYNVRFGDPETQAVLPLLKTDLVDICLACCDGKLKDIKIETENIAAINVVLASKGYPGDYEKGVEIKGLDAFNGMNDMIAFHAGTAIKDGKVVTAGGRVMNITALAPDIESAIDKVYKNIDRVSFEGVYYRRDIGRRALKY
ncbi:MAG: phosphoribosylamine--glycine ligase [Spirochaetia bacterium]|nr:phosphoribosylamine--glycine ligase [Spirochaetia bacterium]